MKSKVVKRSIGLALAFVVLGAFLYTQNHMLTVTEYRLKVWPDGISSATQLIDAPTLNIVHLSDLHSTWFGKSQSVLIKKVQALKPDIVMITGDLVDAHRGDIAPALSLVEALSQTAKVYVSYGNHEGWYFDEVGINGFSEQLSAAGATVLRGTSEVFTPGTSTDLQNRSLVIAGLDDPNLREWSSFEDFPRPLKELKDEARFTILLSHRPEHFDDYVNAGADLVLSGHAHGGQVRLPWIGGVIAPDQGLFPKYDAGIFKREKTAMIVSRGLGNSIVPLRLFNYPEIGWIKLYTK